MRGVVSAGFAGEADFISRDFFRSSCRFFRGSLRSSRYGRCSLGADSRSRKDCWVCRVVGRNADRRSSMRNEPTDRKGCRGRKKQRTGEALTVGKYLVRVHVVNFEAGKKIEVTRCKNPVVTT